MRPAGFAFLLYLVALAGCDVFGTSDPNASGTYGFENEYGFTETIVLRPEFMAVRTFRVEGTVTIVDADGALSGTGQCVRTSTVVEAPGDVTTVDRIESALGLSGERSGNRLRDVRITGCTFTRPMVGEVRGDRLELDTGVKFPVSGGTAVFSDRFGNPERIAFRRTD